MILNQKVDFIVPIWQRYYAYKANRTPYLSNWQDFSEMLCNELKSFLSFRNQPSEKVLFNELPELKEIAWNGEIGVEEIENKLSQVLNKIR